MAKCPLKSIGWIFLVAGGQVGRASGPIGWLAGRQRASKWAAVMMDNLTDSIAVHGVAVLSVLSGVHLSLRLHRVLRSARINNSH